MSDDPLKVLVIPDTQKRPDVPHDQLVWAARLALEERPDVIVHLGDHWDMPSLGGYESATAKVLHERDVLEDIEAGNEALQAFTGEIAAYNRTQNNARRYRPRLVLLRGNHDGETNGGRVHRAMLDAPWLRGFFHAHPLESPGWEVVPFLQPVEIAGVVYCHFFCRSADGRVKQSRRGQPSARLQLQREGISCTAGHQQGLDVASRLTATGRQRAVIAGSCYLHEEPYLTPQGNSHWHGVLIKHHCLDGDYDLEEVSLRQLKARFA